MKGKFKTAFVLLLFLSVISWEYSLAQATDNTKPAPIETSAASRTGTGAGGTDTAGSSYVFNNVTYGCVAGGLMYGHGFQDLDGHLWEIIYMEPGKKSQGRMEIIMK